MPLMNRGMMRGKFQRINIYQENSEKQIASTFSRRYYEQI